MQLRDLHPQEVWRQPSGEVGPGLRQRFDALKALDNTAQDQDPRDGYLACAREDGTLQAILAPVYNGVEYTARVIHDGQLVRGENASICNQGDACQILASHYEATGARRSPQEFGDITTETGAVKTLEAPTVKQWSTKAEPGRANQSVLAEFPADGAQNEDYYYLHNFDLMWNPE